MRLEDGEFKGKRIWNGDAGGRAENLEKRACSKKDAGNVETRSLCQRGKAAKGCGTQESHRVKGVHPPRREHPGVVSSPNRLGYFVTVTVIVLDLTLFLSLSLSKICHMGLIPRVARIV